MRIDTNQPLPEVQAESVTRKPVSLAPPASADIEVEGAESGFTWSRIQAQLDRVEDVRPARVASLSQQLADGTYHVSGEAIASAMLDDLTS